MDSINRFERSGTFFIVRLEYFGRLALVAHWTIPVVAGSPRREATTRSTHTALEPIA